MRTRVRLIATTLVGLLLAACAPRATAIPTTAPTEPPTLAPTAAPTLTPTPVVLSDDEKQNAFTTYKTMLYGEFAARVTLETAERLLAGTAEGLPPEGWILINAVTVKSAEDELRKIEPPVLIEDLYIESLAASAANAAIMARWTQDKITAEGVQAEMGALVDQHQSIVEEAAARLSESYGWDAAALTQTRQDLLDRLPDMFCSAPRRRRPDSRWRAAHEG